MSSPSFPSTHLTQRMRAISMRIRATLFALAGLLLLSGPVRSIETLIPATVIFLLADAALVALGGDARSRWIHGAWSAVMALAIYLRPIYSILTLSFVLLLQVIVWLAGLGMLSLSEWAQDRPQPSTPSRRTDILRLAEGLLLTTAALALQFSPGAGALDRQPILGLVLLCWSGLLWLRRPAAGLAPTEPGSGS
jgi:hypothetical protein